MDLQSILISVPWWGWLLLSVIFLITLARPLLTSSAFKGQLGEKQINEWIKSQLDPEKYILLENVTLPVNKGTTQIDHVIISQYGIFVVETKNMIGWIFADATSPQWTQQIYSQKKQFQNPIRQNYKHIKAISDVLNISTDEIYSVVVFVGDNEFKTPMPEGVFQGQEFIQFIKSKTLQIYANVETIQYLAKKIQEKRIEPSKETDQMHIDNVTALHDDVVNGQKKPTYLKTFLWLAFLMIVVGVMIYIYEKSEYFIDNSVVLEPSDELSIENNSGFLDDFGQPTLNGITREKPDNLELELAKQACNSAIAKALYDSSAGVAEKRDKLCAEYDRLRFE
jgi:restriction system protein